MGYRNWHDLSEVVNSRCIEGGRTTEEGDDSARLGYAANKLADLLGAQHALVVRLYLAWAPFEQHAPKVSKLTIPQGVSLAPSAPVLTLLREDLSYGDRPPGCRVYVENEALIVTNGFEITDDRAALAEQFLEELPDEECPYEELRMAAQVLLERHDFGTAYFKRDENGTYAQAYDVRLLAFEPEPRRLVGCVTLYIKLEVEKSGGHRLTIVVDDALLIVDEYDEVLTSVCAAAATACEQYLLRYVFSTIGNVDMSARIRITVPSENSRNGDVAAGLLMRLKRNLRGKPFGGGYNHGMSSVVFELMDLPAEPEESTA